MQWIRFSLLALAASLLVVSLPAQGANRFMPLSVKTMKNKQLHQFMPLGGGNNAKALKLTRAGSGFLPIGQFTPVRKAIRSTEREAIREDELAHKANEVAEITPEIAPVEIAQEAEIQLASLDSSSTPALNDFLPRSKTKPAMALQHHSKNAKHRWPIDEQAKYRISSPFGMRTHPVTGKRALHEGVDIAAAKGTTVKASAAGTITGAGTHPRLGKYVKVSHDDNTYSLYGHLSRINATHGDTVRQGEKIGEVGSTGRSTGPHLDYSLRKIGGEAFNPMPYLQQPMKQIAAR